MLYSLTVLILISFALLLICRQASLAVWAISYALIALVIERFSSPSLIAEIILWTLFAVLVCASIKPLRRNLLSRRFFAVVSKAMPAMSSTEREALEAGTVSLGRGPIQWCT